MTKLQALNDQYKDWVHRLQREKQELLSEREQLVTENEQMRKRIEQLEKTNSALSARNKVLELRADSTLQNSVQAGVSNQQYRMMAAGGPRNGPSVTEVKNELPEQYNAKVEHLKTILLASKLSQATMRKTELSLRDNGADYFKITRDEGNVELSSYTQFDLIWKYHGLSEDFIVYIDFD